MHIPLYEKIFVTAIGALLLTASFLACAGSLTDVGEIDGYTVQSGDDFTSNSNGDMTIQSGTYEGIPSADPDDGKFLLIAGSGHQTIAGTEVVAYIGIPANESTFEVGIFDGETGGYWDFTGPGTTSFTLYIDPLKNGTTSNVLASWTSDDCADDDWYDQNFTVSSDAQAPSGNYFYRLVVEWQGSIPDTGLNDFKVRTTAQISLAAGHEFGFAGGPQNLGYDPDFGPENTYDGHWCYNFYIPIETSRVVFRDGDADIIYDTDDPNTPPPEGDNDGNPPDDNYLGWGDQVRVSPNVYVVVTDPDGNVYQNSNPSGQGEWELFTIGNLADDDYSVGYTLSPGLWQYEVKGMDAHNANFLETTYEIFVCGATPPLPINPPPEVDPDHDEDVLGGMVYYYPHTITNRGLTQAYDLSGDSNLGWLAGIFEDTNGNGVHDPGELEVDRTPDLDMNETYNVLTAVDVPSGPPGESDTIELTASSRIEWAVQDSAYDDIAIIGNNPPIPDAGGPYFADEGDTVTFDASASYDPDGDPLQYRWDFDGDGIWDTAWSSSPIGSHTWGDDYTGDVILEVSDGSLSATDTTTVTIENVEPAIAPLGPFVVVEGSPMNIIATSTDPGSDDLKFTWEFELGPTITNIYYNDGIGPDPYPSPGGTFPFTATDTVTHTYGDDGIYVIVLTVEDDDGGVYVHTTVIEVINVAPSGGLGGAYSGDEGSSITFTAQATDPGSDDLTFTWEFELGPTITNIYYNDGIGPDPYPSPGGTFPFTATDTVTHIYGDNGIFTLKLTITDDDGGSVTLTTTVTVYNIAPTVAPVGSFAVDEGSPITLNATATDPGSDDLTFEWQFELGPTFTNVHYNDGIGPDPYPSPGGTFPFTATDTVTHIYGDNGIYNVTLTVTDDDGLSVTIVSSIVVNNVAPVVSMEAYLYVSFTLRVAGEKWHDVEMHILEDGTDIGYARVVRYPGSPDDQSVTLSNVKCHVTEEITVRVLYSPFDDPVNGQENGANPAWILVGFEDGTVIELHHTFSVQHPETWEWNMGVNQYLVGHGITFEATATDPGSDDLTFSWVWGDGSPDEGEVYYNDGIGPDPVRSPWGTYPFTALDARTHTYFTAGTFTLVLGVQDDDGGLTELLVIIILI